MTKPPSLLVVVVGILLVLLSQNAKSEISVTGSRSKISQDHWAGIAEDLINAGSPALLSVTGDAASQRNAVTDGTSSSAIMYLDQNQYTVTYTFDTSSHVLGYDLTTIDSYAGWSKWRVNQIYEVAYTTVSNPAPVSLASVDYRPIVNGSPNGSDMSTRVHITDSSGVLARNVKSIIFTFKGDATQPASGMTYIGAVYRELDVVGRPSVPEMTRTLANYGSSNYVIVLPDHATEAERNAADQLQAYFYVVTDVTLSVERESNTTPGKNRIFVGKGSSVSSLLGGQGWTSSSWEKLGTDGFTVKTIGADIVLTGNEDRGTLYAVFDFLERELGCRWWTAKETDIPNTPVVQVPNLDFTETPGFAYREHYTTDVTSPLNALFATAMRENGHHQPQSEQWGSHYSILGFVHTHFDLVPPATNFSLHPDWYTDSDGNPYTTNAFPIPSKGTSQLCLSKPGVVQTAANTALAWIASNPKAGYVSISENDNGNYCKCSSCAGLRALEGSQSGPNLDFVNKVAALIHAQYPEIIVETLAYRGTLRAPMNISPGPNVLIRFAPLQADFGHPLDSAWNGPIPPFGPPGQDQDNVQENLPIWAEISQQLFVWNYVTNFYYTMLPYPNFNLIGEDLRFFLSNKVTGVFEQGDHYTGGVGDFSQLRAWVTAKLLWNPLIDQNIYTREFLDGYYGAAAPYLGEYIDLVQASYLETNRKLGANEVNFSYMTLETMNEAKSLFDQAEAALASDPERLSRVRRERVALDLLWLYRYNPLRQVASFTSQPFVGPGSPLSSLSAIDSTATSFGVVDYTPESPIGRFSQHEVPRLHRKLAANLGAYVAANIPPDILNLIPANTEKENLIILHPDDLQVLRPEWADVVSDPAASSGVAIHMSGTVGAWAVQYDLSQYQQSFFNESKWQMYVIVRVAGAPTALAWNFFAGVYDTLHPSAYVISERPEYIADQNYHLIKIGDPAKITATSYLFLTPEGNGVPGVYFDRVIFVRRP